MSYHVDVIQAALANDFFRKVLHTTERSQLVVMCVQPGDDIGLETHHLDQVLVFVSGTGEYLLGEAKGGVCPGSAVVVPAGTRHNFVNTGTEPLRLYTVYAPPEHPDGTIHKTKAEAEEAEAAEHGHGGPAAAPAAPARGATAAPRGLTVGSLIGK